MSNSDLPSSEKSLEELLSRPTAQLTEAMNRITGDLMILGAGGKMGPSLARLASRAAPAKRIIAVSRFSDSKGMAALTDAGIETISGDLLDQSALAGLPDVPNIIFMAGQKFGTGGDEPRTWAINALLPGLIAERFRHSRIVAFSTGNVYPFSPVNESGPVESDPVRPVGEYAQSALARERILAFQSQRFQIPMAIVRLNYAIEARYGVLRDIADRVWRGESVDVSMGWVNIIWQRDANAMALQCLDHCTVPPFIINVTGTSALPVRTLAQHLADRWGKPLHVVGEEAETALLSNAIRMRANFGEPEFSIASMIDVVAHWVEIGGRSLGKATKFENREGIF